VRYTAAVCKDVTFARPPSSGLYSCQVRYCYNSPLRFAHNDLCQNCGDPCTCAGSTEYGSSPLCVGDFPPWTVPAQFVVLAVVGALESRHTHPFQTARNPEYAGSRSLQPGTTRRTYRRVISWR
jgi:hypothetical protein